MQIVVYAKMTFEKKLQANFDFNFSVIICFEKNFDSKLQNLFPEINPNFCLRLYIA